MGVLIVAAMLCFVMGIDAVALLGDCSGDPTSCDAGLVCETAADTCRVKADGTSTDCASTDGKCPANAACDTTTCSCNDGYIVVTTGDTAGLCVVQDAACSDTVACGDTTNYVCSSSKCKVRADGSKTDCQSTNDYCVPNAACSTTTCNCNSGYIHSSGLCTVLGADCSSNACGDTDNYVCESDACVVKANGQATSCSADDHCPSNAACTTQAGTCSCDATYKEDAGLCILVIGSTCESASDCSALSNTQCYKLLSFCTKGICSCDTGYSGADCTTLGYDKACSTSTDKCATSLGLACDSGTTKCACDTDGETYRSEVGKCTNKKILGEECSGAGTGDCYTTTNAECDTTCKCSSGYVQDGQTCRRPYAGGSCTDTCIPVDTSTIFSGSETSQQAPTCTGDGTDKTCGCGSNEEVSRQIGSTCYTVCLSAYGGSDPDVPKDDGETCSAFNECSSKVCAQCPGDDNKKCYSASCNFGVRMTADRIAICSSILLLFHIF